MVHPRRLFLILALVIVTLIALGATVGVGSAIQNALPQAASVAKVDSQDAPAPEALVVADHTVCSAGCDYTTIQAAVDAATAGDIILIDDSLHTESGITIDQNVTIIGHGAAQTTIQAAASATSAPDRIFEVAEGVTAGINHLTLANGSASAGGAVYNSGALAIDSVEIRDNQAGEFGGALYNTVTGTISLIGTTLYNNIVSNTQIVTGTGGGALFNAGTALIRNSTISSNTSEYSLTLASGGGLLNTGVMTLEHATIASNSSGLFGYGAGISNTVSGTISVNNSIIADNLGGDDCADAGSWTVVGDNLDSDGSCTGFTVQNGSARLNPLAYYGGPVRTQAIQYNSDARDAASSCPSFGYDQRGAARPFSTTDCDLGAFESYYYYVETTFSSPIAIANNSDASDSVTVTLPISAVDMPVLDVDVTVSISHNDPGDLEITLDHPEQTGSVLLMDNPTGNCTNVSARFDDEGDSTASNACDSLTSLTGAILPNQPLSSFDSYSSTGPWTLTVADTSGGQSGSWNSWILYLEYRPPLAVTLTTDPEEDGCQPGNCSLREAIVDANQDPGADLIYFTSDGTVTLSQSGLNEDQAYSGDLDITEDLTIIGRGLNETIVDGDQVDRVFDVHSSGGPNLTILNMTVTGGDADTSGGGLRSQSSGHLVFEGTVFNQNVASNNGGGLYLTGGTAWISGTAIVNNTAGSGGGLFIEDESVTITNATISGNGSGLINYATADDSSVSLTNVTIAGQTSGAVAQANSGRTSSMTFNNSILANNATNCTETGAGTATILSDDYNLSDDNSCGFNQSNDFDNEPADVGTLEKDVASGTWVNPLGPTSPAIDSANPNTCPPYDVRGRPRRGVCDMGSAEFSGFIVTNNNDSGTGSLRAAVNGANHFPGADDIYFSDAVSGTVIILTSNQMTITEGVTVHGLGAQYLTVSGNNARRVLTTDGSFQVNISGMSLINGDAGSENGGGIYVNGSQVTLVDINLIGNAANNGGAISINSGGSLNADSILFSNNVASSRGGALHGTSASQLNLQEAIIIQNDANNGGGMYLNGSSAWIAGSAFVSNTVDTVAGGLFVVDSEVGILNSTLSGNDHSGLYNYANGINSSVTITNGTMANQGYGLISYALNGRTAEVKVQNSVLANNSTANCGFSTSGNPLVTSLGYNLSDDNSCSFGESSDFDNVAAYVGDLEQDSVSGTWVHPLVYPSPAIDAATTSSCPTYDQRGRPRRGVCDMGAAESDIFLVTNTSNSGIGSLRAAVEGANQFSGPDNVHFRQSLPPGSTITLSGENLLITESVKIEGLGPQNVIVSGNNGRRVFNIDGSFPVVLSGMTIRDGNAGTGASGGGIHNNGGQLTLLQMALIDNQANDGGALAIINGSLAAEETVFYSNSANDTGGAMYLINASVAMSQTAVANNSAAFVGGIYAFDSDISALNTTFADNGDLAIRPWSYNRDSKVSLSFVTFAGQDRGIWIRASENKTGEVEFFNTLLADYGIRNCSLNEDTGGSALFTSLGYNMATDITCFLDEASDHQGISEASVGLLPLEQDAGTFVRPFDVSSAAVDAGSNSGCPAVDQRGATRPFDGNGDETAVCDIGAYEVQEQGAVIFLPVVIK